jgi:hypothetical protein
VGKELFYLSKFLWTLQGIDSLRPLHTINPTPFLTAAFIHAILKTISWQVGTSAQPM